MQRITMAAIFTFLRYVGSSELIRGSTLSSVTSNLERYYRPSNTELSLTSEVGQLYFGSKRYYSSLIWSHNRNLQTFKAPLES